MKVHFIGVGGIGTSALARYFLSQSWEVSGSDNVSTPLLQELKTEGVKIQIGHHKKNLNSKVDLVIYTQATPLDNPELKEAKRLGIKYLSYPKALGELTKELTTIALAGTHGKSTTTALTALVFLESAMDPTIVVGAKIPRLGGKNFRLGKSKYLVIEADEYKDAFFHYYPRAALITNIDREHLDYFKNLNHIKRSFRKFIGNLDNNGILVLNKDSAPLFSLGKQLKRDIIWYSLREKKLAQKIKRHLKIYGEHNLSNAVGVYKLAKALGVKEKNILTAFSKYHGAWRRMEFRGWYQQQGTKNKIPVYDDYAHHPTEIKATLHAFREKFPQSAGWRIICVFQPHQAERLKKLFKEFSGAFDGADALILLDIFKVTGRERQATRDKEQGVNSKKLATAIRKRKGAPETIYLPHSNKLKSLVKSQITNHKSRSVVVMMGAGNIVDLTPKLLE